MKKRKKQKNLWLAGLMLVLMLALAGYFGGMMYSRYLGQAVLPMSQTTLTESAQR